MATSGIGPFADPDVYAASLASVTGSPDSSGGFASILSALNGIGSTIITGLQRAGTFGTSAQLSALGYSPAQTYQALYGTQPIGIGTVIVVLGGVVVLVLVLGRVNK